MAISKTQTPICLNGFAEFANIDPLLFNCIDISSCVHNYQANCEHFWTQWKSREMYNQEDLAECLCFAYERVKQFTGISPTLEWQCEEIEIESNWFTNVPPGIHIANMTFRTDYGMIKEFGQRLFEKLDTVDLIYVDNDGDTFNEEAVLRYTVPDDVPICDLKIYHTGTDYEICPIEIVLFEEKSRVIEIKIDAWNLIKPEKYMTRSWLPIRGFIACDEENFVLDVDIYKDTVDPCKPQIEIIYPDNHQCGNSCRDNIQPACVRLIDKCNGYFQIVPQKFDCDGCVIEGDPCNMCACPYKIKIHYRAGCHSDTCTGQCDDNCRCKMLHRAVYMLASVCLPSYSCNCECMDGEIQQWQQNTSLVSTDSKARWNIPASLKNNIQLGLTWGELSAQMLLDQIGEEFCCRGI